MALKPETKVDTVNAVLIGLQEVSFILYDHKRSLVWTSDCIIGILRSLSF